MVKSQILKKLAKYQKEIKFKTLHDIERLINSNDLTISDSKY